MKKLITLMVALACAATTFAQIPNNGLENWQTKAGIGMTGPYTYEVPQSWEPGFISGILATMGIKPNIGKSGIKHSGNFALKLASNADTIGADVASSFSLGSNMRPSSLDGYFQTSGVVNNPNNYAQAFIFLTKWNGTKTDTIGFGMTDLDNSPNSFKPFSATVQYISTANPDSATIYFLYFPESANTHVLVDDVSFAFMLGTQENKPFPELSFLPNPVNGNQAATLTFTARNPEKASLIILDAVGKEVKNLPLQNIQAGANRIAIDTGELKNGFYLAKLVSASGSQTFRFVKR